MLPIILVVLSLHQPPAASSAPLEAVYLRCEYQAAPLAVGTSTPLLTWRLLPDNPDARGLRQEGYRVVAASSLDLLNQNQGDIADTGDVGSSRMRHILTTNLPLQSNQTVWWKVGVWSQGGVVHWSAPATFTMGLLEASTWEGKWIEGLMSPAEGEADFYLDRPAPLLRKSFTLDQPVRRARLHVSGLGFYEVFLNGQRVGDHVLDPGWTTFEKRVFYSTFDVTGLLGQGSQAVGLLLGNGWYNPLPSKMWNRFNLREALTVGPPRAIVQLDIELADGSRTSVFSDETWRTAPSPLLWNDIYQGTRYDARQEAPGWSTPGFDDAGWHAVRVADRALGPLEAQPIPPMRVAATLDVAAITEPTPGVFILDFGQNFAGRVRMHCEGPSGTRVQLRYGELLHGDGTLNAMTTVWGQMKNRKVPEDGPIPATAWQQDSYILRGEGPEEYAPPFTYHGFRYVEVTGFPGIPAPENFVGEWIHTDLQRTGGFECSNTLFNDIYEMSMKTLLNNVHSVQTDCPHREKFGYGGDIVASSEMALYNFDMAAFYRKVVRDFADAQRSNGGFTETAPFVGIDDFGLGGGAGPIGWGTAHPLLLSQLYHWYDDVELIEDEWQHAAEWMALLESTAQEGILDNGIGDHESLVDKDTAVSGTAFYQANLQLMGLLSEAVDAKAGPRSRAGLGAAYREQATHYGDVRGQVREAFIRRFIDSETGKVGLGTQANQAFALYWFWLGDLREKVMDFLIRDIEAHDYHLTTGIFGTKYMLDVLPAEVAFKIVNQRGFPGWGHMLEEGATTLWEHWEFSDNTFSHNHPMFGSVCDWFTKKLAGLSLDSRPNGFRIAPQPCGDVTWASAWADAAAGKAAVSWRIAEGKFRMDVTLPPNTLATITFPKPPTGALDVAAILESGKALKEQAESDENMLFPDPERVVVGSGGYHFELDWPAAP
ncbi:MAG: family 78 glycoside hydrolase catalytic domain [Candidatus Hydrogenedentes bacterium]|nr:family 78 glycoside hydrolase catalytic domain [Candidatus Hydrogenedentota bacterium]